MADPDCTDPATPVCVEGACEDGKGPCLKCFDAINTDDPKVCPESQALYDAIVECMCTGPCAGICQNSLCVGKSMTADECTNCYEAGG